MISVFGLVIADVLARRKGIEDADRLNRVRLLGAIGGASPMGVVVTSVLVDREAEAAPATPAQPNNPVPTVTSLNPPSAIAGAAAFQLTVIGANFVNGARVRWNGVERPATFVSATQLTVQITSDDVAAGSTVPVTVVNPAPGGGEATLAAIFQVNNLTPAISSLALITNNRLTVTGNNFVPSSIVRWDGGERRTTFNSATQLTAQLESRDAARTKERRVVTVTVFNPPPGGGIAVANYTIEPE